MVKSRGRPGWTRGAGPQRAGVTGAEAVCAVVSPEIGRGGAGRADPRRRRAVVRRAVQRHDRRRPRCLRRRRRRRTAGTRHGHAGHAAATAQLTIPEPPARSAQRMPPCSRRDRQRPNPETFQTNATCFPMLADQETQPAGRPDPGRDRTWRYAFACPGTDKHQAGTRIGRLRELAGAGFRHATLRGDALVLLGSGRLSQVPAEAPIVRLFRGPKLRPQHPKTPGLGS